MRQNNTSGTGVNSTQTTPRAKRFPYFLRDMRKLTLSEEQTYQVSFTATVRKEYGDQPTGLDFSCPYKTVHPLLALGYAIADCEDRYFSTEIKIGSIRIKKF